MRVRWAQGSEREAQGGDTCIPRADSRCCTAKTCTTLESNHIPIKKIKQMLKKLKNKHITKKK